MQTFASHYSFSDTLTRLRQFFAEHDLKIFAEIDHAEEAEAAGLTLGPTTVLVFGNPKAGTFLMQDDIHIAVELPLKVLLFEKEKTCMVGYRTPSTSLKDYAVEEHRAILDKMDVLMKNIVAAVS